MQSNSIAYKKTCIEKIDGSSLSPSMASRLVPLNKNPGLRTIGVGELLRRVMGKTVMSTFFEDVTTTSSDRCVVEVQLVRQQYTQ